MGFNSGFKGLSQWKFPMTQSGIEPATEPQPTAPPCAPTTLWTHFNCSML